MKRLSTLLVLMIITLVTFASCKDDKNPAQQYGNTMLQSSKKAKDVDSTVNVQQVQKSIQEFYAANGKYPADLNELTKFNGITLKSDKYEYNPSTGSLIEKQ